MRKVYPTILLVFLLALATKLDAKVVYVAPDGNDTNPGTIDSPFVSIYPKAYNAVVAGDTIFVRGGIFTYNTTQSLSKSGNASQRYHLLAYPGERPLLDFSSMPVSSSNRGIKLSGSYWYVNGLDVKGAGDNGMFISGSNNVIENCTFFENRDTGLQIGNGGANNQIINCDSYNNADPGQGNADGFAPKLDVGTGNYFYGCRAWQNSDDGWDGYMRGADDVTTTLEKCWTFKNGYLANGSPSVGNGNGFKMGGGDSSNISNWKHNMILKNCVAFDNRVKGFDQNNNAGSMTLYNCTAYRNGSSNYSIPRPLASGKTATVTNCVALGAYGNLGAFVVQQTDSWMPPFVTTADDFVSVDTTGVRGPRNADGSLPDVAFMHFVAGSDLIDGGTDVGLPFDGLAPDLGAFEYESGVVTYTIMATAGLHGMIVPSGSVVVIDGHDTSFAVVPDPGFHVDSLIVDGFKVDSTASYTFTNVQSNHTIRVVFAINQLTLTINAVHGSVIKVPDQVLYDSGSTVQLTAVPATSYHFTFWSGDVPPGNESDNPLLMTLNESATLTASFAVDVHPIVVSRGWNMISLSYMVEESRKDQLFPGAISQAFSYSGQYEARDTLRNGIGYWLKFPSPETVMVAGVGILSDTFNLASGWNLIGSIAKPVPVATIASEPPGMITSEFYQYSGRYTGSDTIEPNRGYWVKVNSPGLLVLSSGETNLPDMSPSARVRIVPNGENPPVPPTSDELDISAAAPTVYTLSDNYPNPFNPTTDVRYSISDVRRVSLKVCDVLGREITTLVDEVKSPGEYTVRWNAGDNPGGVYFYKLVVGGFHQTKKMLLIK